MSCTENNGTLFSFNLIRFITLLVISLTPYLASAATFVVNTTDDRGGDSFAQDNICDTRNNPNANPPVPPSGICTMRAAIEQANATPGMDTISVNVNSVQPRRQLPAVTDSARILSGLTQHVSLNGFNAGTSSVDGLVISATDVTVSGFIVERFRGNGIVLAGARNATIRGNHIGTKPSVTTTGLNVGNGGSGIVIRGGSSDNTIGGDDPRYRNVISASGRYGIIIYGASSHNKIYGNYIGTNIAGTHALGNTQTGIFISGNSSNNEIGSLGFVTGNVISGNGVDGVIIQNSNNTVILQNKIGTNEGGNAAIANGRKGIFINGSNNTVIGAGANRGRNIISGNTDHGIQIQQSDGCTIENNYIGIEIIGRTALRNGNDGIFLSNTRNCTIGGQSASRKNVISGNADNGIQISGNTSDNNIVIGNYIGMDKTADAGVANGDDGVLISNAPNSKIGGPTANDRNIISSNGDDGIQIQDSDARQNKIEGNYIGTDRTGMLDFGNTSSGIFISNAPDNFIGGANQAGTQQIRGNVISGNGDDGVVINGSDAKNNKVQSNLIGLKQNGTEILTNVNHGVIITNASENLIGGRNDNSANTFYRNVISGNKIGVKIQEAQAKHNKVQGSYIGTDKFGNNDLGNTENGVLISRAPSNVIGGSHAGERNVISGNDESGVKIQRRESVGNRIIGNYIGVKKDGTTALPNEHDGVTVVTNASKNFVGGKAAGEGNTIAYNKENGVTILSGEKNSILGNNIFKNTKMGIDLEEDGLTQNDRRDPDPGANKKHNYAYITADSNNARTSVDAIIQQGLSNEIIRVEFFSNEATHRENNHFGEGQTYLGEATATTDAHGYAYASLSEPVAAGLFVTATATDSTGNTSELSCAGGMIDIDIDSDNSNRAPDYGPAPSGADASDDQIESDPTLSGRYVLVNNNDDDNDYIRDYFDGFNRDSRALNGRDDNNAQEKDFVKIRIKLHDVVDTAQARLRIRYEASRPSAIAAPVANPPVYAIAPGRLRIWTKNGNIQRDLRNLSNGGDFVMPADYPLATFSPDANKEFELWLEAVRPSKIIGGDDIVVSLDPDGTAGPIGFECLDSVRVTATQLDVLDNADHPVKHVQTTRWDNAYGPAAGGFAVHNLAAAANNFIDRDPENFRIQIIDASKNTNAAASETINITLGTLQQNRRTNDDNNHNIRLDETGHNTGIFRSATQLMMSADLPVADNPDDQFRAHDGRAAAIADDRPNDRTHKASIDGFLNPIYTPTAGLHFDHITSACERTAPEERRILDIHVTVFNEPFLDIGYDHDGLALTPPIHGIGNGVFDFNDVNNDHVHNPGESSEMFWDLSAGAGGYGNAGARSGVVDQNHVDQQIARSDIAWAQGCIRINQVGATRFVEAPNTIAGANILADGVFNNADARRVIATYAPGAAVNTAEVFFAAPMARANAFTHGPWDRIAALGERTFMYIVPNLDIRYRTLAHEIGHALDNGPDAANTQITFYPANTTFMDNVENQYRRLSNATINNARTERAAGAAHMRDTGNRMLHTP
ncbi:MAG: right-handed parallel beta-helix repeat-containing protein [Porticoccaceae bacterium]|nr:right-handed parallel beta-helix repeat-containing protein [Porticoccaceae bacterium]